MTNGGRLYSVLFSIFVLINNLYYFVNASSDKYVRGCYYTNWAQYRDGVYKFDPSNIDPTLCNVIYFAFGTIDDMYTLQFFEWNDESMLEHIIALKKARPGLQVVMSVGGWKFNSCSEGPCDRFSKLAESPDFRYTFIQSTVSFLRNYGFDGLDIDWEFPGHPDRNGYGPVPRDDAGNLILLVKELRLAMNKEAFIHNRARLSLSIAVGVGPVNSKGYHVRALCDPEFGVDHVNLMTYDMHGTWEPYAGHNAPLFATTSDVEAFGYTISDAQSIEDWLSQGCEPSKLILGMATYGRGYLLSNNSNHEFLAPIKGSTSPGPGTQMDGFFSYKEIDEMLKSGIVKEVWDEERGVPYAYNDYMWIGYDNERSIRLKAAYAKHKKLGGGMIWTLDFDDFQDAKYPLLRAMNAEFDTTSNTLFGDPPVCLTATLASEAPLDTSQIIPEFPPGIWDGVDCSEATLTALPGLCFDALGFESTDAEKLACAILNNSFALPIGLYKNHVMLDTELDEMKDSMLSKIIDTCGVAKLIDNACFSYTGNNWPANSRVRKVMDEFTYSRTKKLETGFKTNSQVKFSTSPQKVNFDQGIAFGRSVVEQNVNASKFQSDYKFSSMRAEWNAEFGRLSLDSCLQGEALKNTGIVNEQYLSDWRQLENIENPVAVFTSHSFARIMNSGMMFPSKYAFAIRLATNIMTMYSAMIEAADYVMEKSYNDAFTFSGAGQSVSDPVHSNILPALRDDEGAIGLNARIYGSVTRVGECNFDAVSGDKNAWSMHLQKCATRAASSIERMPPAAYIPDGGFVSVEKIIAASGVTPNPFVALLISRLSRFCRCAPSKTSYDCYTFDSNKPYTTTSMENCVVSYWVPIILPPVYMTLDVDTEKNGLSVWELRSYGNEASVVFNADSGIFRSTANGQPGPYNFANVGTKFVYASASGTVVIVVDGTMRILYQAPALCFGGGPYGLFLGSDGYFNTFSIATGYVCSRN